MFKFKHRLLKSGILRGKTDIHSHVLPGVDDGSPDMRHSMGLLDYMEVDLGFRTIWLTPHVMEGNGNTPSRLRKRFDELLTQYKGKMQINLSSEYMMDSHFHKHLEAGPLRLGEEHLLVETSYLNGPNNLLDILLSVWNLNLKPLIAHPERYMYMDEKDYQQHYEGFDPNSPESNILFELVQDKNLENSIQLAKFMQKNICAATGRQDKGVYQDNLAVLRLTSMPACLMELGFISTADEEQYLNSDRALQQFTRGFYNAFVAYKNKVAPGISVPYKPAAEIPVEQKPQSAKETAVPETPASQVAPETQETPASPEKLDIPVTPENPAKPSTTEKTPSTAPVFKVQILASATPLKAGNSQFKGLTDVSSYQEGGMYKYTVGASSDYQEIYQLRKSIVGKFPQAFIIAFRGSEKMDVNEAIREYKSKKVKK